MSLGWISGRRPDLLPIGPDHFGPGGIKGIPAHQFGYPRALHLGTHLRRNIGKNQPDIFFPEVTIEGPQGSHGGKVYIIHCASVDAEPV